MTDARRNSDKITGFFGEYRFLSNFYSCEFLYQGYRWPSAEHAYQAMKFINEKYWNLLAYGNITPGTAKRMGSEVELPDHWDSSKLNIMRSVVFQKFDQNPDLMSKLDSTKGRELIEGNTWGDTFWGQSSVGKGRNELGKILMSIRDDIMRFS